MSKSPSYTVVTTVSVALTIMFYAAFVKYVGPIVSGVPGLGFVAGLFASIGFYVSLFQVLLWTYFKFFQDHVNPEEAIIGEWFYKLQVRGKEEEPRYGVCRISRIRSHVFIAGIHYDPVRKRFTSRFSSDCVVLEGHNLMILYTSFGVDEETFTRRGAFYLSTEENPPRRIYGVWTDVLPNRNAGDIVMERRDKHTDSILDSIGYPKDSSELQQVLSLPISAPPISEPLQSKNGK